MLAQVHLYSVNDISKIRHYKGKLGLEERLDKKIICQVTDLTLAILDEIQERSRST